MGLFDKKNCDICGEKIGLLGNRKLDDGNLCKNCAKKLSPWFEERRHSTIEDIKRQLEYREQNKQKVENFRVTRQIATRTYNIFIDDTNGNFADISENPDIVPLSSVTMCKMEVKQDRREEKYNKDGNMVSYQPPVYHYEYDYTMRIKVRTPWFDDMDFKLNNISLEEKDRHEIMEIEQTGNQIVAALTGNVAMNSGMQNMNGGMQYGNMGMNNGMQNMNGNMGMNQNMNANAQPQTGGTWTCQCGAENTGAFCEFCGTPKP